MNNFTCLLGVVALLGMMSTATAESSESSLRILLLTKSAGFEHSVIARDESGTSHVERILRPIADEMGAVLECTKDASRINAEELKSYSVVIFYTSGDLTQPGTDGHPPMTPEGLEALFDWIRGGGGFLGFHAATDSFRSTGNSPTPYIEMLGAEFVKHGDQFIGTIKNTSPGHPAIASLPETWPIQDEWYLFRKFNKENMHVLALLELGEERSKQRMYNIPDYPMLWCLEFGEGRVLYNGMGHREDVWEHDIFKAIVREHIEWVSGKGPLNATPNYAEVVPESIP